MTQEIPTALGTVIQSRLTGVTLVRLREGWVNYSQTVSHSDEAVLKSAHLWDVLFDNTVEWEYGYVKEAYEGKSTSISATGLTPDGWLRGLSTPYRRRKRMPIREIDWAVYEGPVTIKLDSRPWHKPGTDYSAYPLHYRSPYRSEEFSEWAPGDFFEQDIEKYGFRYAPCGRSDKHWPHSKLDGTDYCHGRPEREHREV